MLLTTRHDHLVFEMVKWAILVTLAFAISLLVASRASGGPDRPRLPMQVDEFTRPSPGPEAVPNEPPVAKGFEAVLRLSRILDLHAANEYDAALAEWRTMSLPPETAVWRHVAMAAANLRLRAVDAALERLQKARAIEPNNPVVQFFLGLAYREKAADARDWLDAGEPPALARFATWPETAEAPNSRNVYELRAIKAFERAIERAGEVAWDWPLAPPAWGMPDVYELAMPMVVPTVGDLLRALGADNFAAKSHHILGRMYLDHGWSDQAEFHLDGAADGGLNPALDYRALGEWFESHGQMQNALRAYYKARRQPGGDLVVPNML